MWRSHVTSKATVTEIYDQLVKKDVIAFDQNQKLLADACGPLVQLIKAQADAGITPHSHGFIAAAAEKRQNLYTSALASISDWASSLFPLSQSRQIALLFPENIGVVQKRGLYIWGSVGIGKTMILDLFDLCDTPLPKRRAHLHSFMTEISDRLFAAELRYREMRMGARTDRERRELASMRPMDLVVSDILAETPVLCFDEFQTFDVAHAALLASFFSCAFQRGLFLLTTSNRPPEDLCHVSASFSAFLPVLHTYCQVLHCPSENDYRTSCNGAVRTESCHANVFVFPNKLSSSKKLVERVESCIRQKPAEWVKDDELWHHGRSMRIPFRCGGVALFNYSELCGNEQNLSSADFQIIARTFHTVVISNVPQIGVASKNDAHQFIVLVDELYQYNVKLLFTCRVPWQEIMSTKGFHTGVETLSGQDSYYSEGEDDRSGYAAVYQFRNEEESISFTRIQSRLREMGSSHYLLRDHSEFVVEDFDFSGLVVSSRATS